MLITQFRLIFFSFLIILSPIVRAGSGDSFASDPRWLQLLQYEKTSSGWLSKNKLKQGFLAEHGQTDPLAELNATLETLKTPAAVYGKTDQIIACVYQARKYLLQQNLKIEFPAVECADFEKWKSAINITELRIVFAGPYVNNPASMMGHTFFRFANPEKENQRPGQELLSYSAGYVANVGASDSIVTYAKNGIFGGYGGILQVAPYYQNTGIYNNSENRDLWEFPLNLSQEELEYFLKIIWEMQWTEVNPYYFFKENCSFRPLVILNTIRPETHLTQDLKLIVLPLDAVRVLETNGFLREIKPRFRAAMDKKIQYLTASMPFEKKWNYFWERPDKDIDVLDALILKYGILNLKKKTLLKKEERIFFDDLLKTRAELAIPSKDISDDELRPLTTGSPLGSHKSSWFSIGTETSDSQLKSRETAMALSYRLGAHPRWASSKGYLEGSSIEYLGFDWGLKKQILLTEIETLNELSVFSWRPSWFVQSALSESGFEAHGALGISAFNFYILPELKTYTVSRHHQLQTELVKDFLSGFIIEKGDFKLRLERTQAHWAFTSHYAINVNQSLTLMTEQSEFYSLKWNQFF